MKKIVIALISAFIISGFTYGTTSDASSPEIETTAGDGVWAGVNRPDVPGTGGDRYDMFPERTEGAGATESDGNPADNPVKKIYVFPIRENIMPSTVRLTAKCLSAAREMGADYIIINMNTYGGLVDAADSIRTMILNCETPVFTFVNNQAVSAGALISISSDSIYMRPGASMGAATVVGQDGMPMPDKYQSFMRSMMRSTAETHGKIDVVKDGKTVSVWRRDPLVAEAMVDPSVIVPGLSGEGKIVTFTADEAIKWRYCEGKASQIQEILEIAGIDNYEITEYETTWLDRLLGFLTNPALQGILIMLIIGGIYFELQTPGIGFPLAVSVLGALLYFSPLYIEGLVSHWELAVFITGIILILIEIFATPGFGLLGILGIISIIAGLAFALIDAELLKHIPTGEISAGIIVQPFAIVLISTTLAFVLSIWLSNRFLKGKSALRDRIALALDMTPEEGFVSHETNRGLVGQQAVTSTALRPTGKLVIDGRYYEAAGENAMFIEKGVTVVITRDEGGVLYCRPE